MESLDRKRRPRRNWSQLIRRGVQIAFLAFVLTASVRHGLLEGTTSTPSTDALCPFGGLETVWRVVKEMVDVTNMTSSADIRGWMTLQQVADGFGIQQPELYRMLGIPAETPPETPLKDLEAMLPDLKVSAVREIIGAYLGEHGAADEPGETAGDQPQSPPTPTIADPVEAPAMSQPTPVATIEHIPQGDGSGDGPAPAPEGQFLAGADIKGRHTLADIVEQAQVPLSELLQALHLPADTDPATAVRELVESGQVTQMQVVRDAVTALQGKAGE